MCFEENRNLPRNRTSFTSNLSSNNEKHRSEIKLVDSCIKSKSQDKSRKLGFQKCINWKIVLRTLEFYLK